MKKLLMGAVAGTLLAPAAAHAETTGYVDVAYEYSEITGGGGSADSWNLAAAVQHDFANGWSLQGDGRSTQFDNGSFTVGASYTALHLYTALNPSIDVGGFVGMLDFSNDATIIGVESRVHQGQWSLQGSLGYTQFHVTLGTSEAWDARVLGDWFVNPDTSVRPSLSYTEWHEGNFTHKQTGVGLGAAHRLGNGLEVYGAYVHSFDDTTPAGQYEVDTFRVGMRLHLNAGDLQTITNEGARWNGAAGMYEAFGRW